MITEGRESRCDNSIICRPVRKERKRRQLREFTDGGGLTSLGEASWEKPLAWAQEEMGVADDGSILNGEFDREKLLFWLKSCFFNFENFPCFS